MSGAAPPERALRALLSCCCVAALGCAEQSSAGPIDAPAPPSLVVGVLSDFGPELDRLRFVIDGGGEVVREGVLEVGNGDAPLAFPLELRVDELPDATPVAVELEAFHAGEEAPFLTRKAATETIAGKTSLLPIRLEAECVPGAAICEGLVAPECAAPMTCIGAACADPHVPGIGLPIYTAGWASPTPDDCKPIDDGPATLEIGEGYEAFTALPPSGEIHAIGGIQGGFHFFLALRMQNLRGKGSITYITSHVRAEAPVVSKTAHPYDRVEDACDLLGIRYILPFEIHDPDLTPAQKAATIIGKTLEMHVKVVDPFGESAVATRTLVISDDVIFSD